MLVSEPGNPAKSTVKQRQLRLFTIPSVAVDKPCAKPKRRTQKKKYIQNNLFDSFDGDAEKSTAKTS